MNFTNLVSYSIQDLADLITPEKLDELEFLTMFVKEVIRYSPPGASSLGYRTKEDVRLREVVVPKGQNIFFNIIGSHFNKDQWINPMEFRPERFDPASEYFKTPSGKSRHPLAYIPFTFGTRACPGRSLGKFKSSKTRSTHSQIFQTISFLLLFSKNLTKTFL